MLDRRQPYVLQVRRAVGSGIIAARRSNSAHHRRSWPAKLWCQPHVSGFPGSIRKLLGLSALIDWLRSLRLARPPRPGRRGGLFFDCNDAGRQEAAGYGWKLSRQGLVRHSRRTGTAEPAHAEGVRRSPICSREARGSPVILDANRNDIDLRLDVSLDAGSREAEAIEVPILYEDMRVGEVDGRRFREGP